MLDRELEQTLNSLFSEAREQRYNLKINLFILNFTK